MNRKVQYTVAIVMTVIVGAVFYYAFIDPQLRRQSLPLAISTDSVVDTGTRHPLTGMLIATTTDFFAASVMLDNFETVKNQPGLEQAGIVYEALAEGGITRLMAVFDSSIDVERIGPIRSVRPYFIDWASEYGGILMHVGGSPEALAQLKSLNTLIDIDQIGAREIYFERDGTLKAPHNVFASFSSWLQIKDRLSVANATIQSWRYDSPPIEADVPDRQQIDIVYSPDTKVSWVYNKEKNTYIRFYNGTRQLTTDGGSIAASNLIVIEVPADTIDTIGRQRMRTLGSGTARVYRNGLVASGTWIKETRGSRMRFIGDDQQELALTPGTSWIAVVPSFDVVSSTSV